MLLVTDKGETERIDVASKRHATEEVGQEWVNTMGYQFRKECIVRIAAVKSHQPGKRKIAIHRAERAPAVFIAITYRT